MSFSFYCIFSVRLKAGAHGWEIHIQIRKHHESYLILMRTCIVDLLLCKWKRKGKKSFQFKELSMVFPWAPNQRVLYPCEIELILHFRLKESYFSSFYTAIETICSHTVVLMCPSCIFHREKMRPKGSQLVLPRPFWGLLTSAFGRKAAKGCSFSPEFFQLESKSVSFFIFSYSCLIYSLCGKEMRLGGLQKRASQEWNTSLILDDHYETQ